MTEADTAFKVVLFQLQNHRKLVELLSLILEAFVTIIRTYTLRMSENTTLRTWEEEVTGDGENNFYFSSNSIRKAVPGT
jgi:hypothetical protein